MRSHWCGANSLPDRARYAQRAVDSRQGGRSTARGPSEVTWGHTRANTEGKTFGKTGGTATSIGRAFDDALFFLTLDCWFFTVPSTSHLLRLASTSARCASVTESESVLQFYIQVQRALGPSNCFRACRPSCGVRPGRGGTPGCHVGTRSLRSDQPHSVSGPPRGRTYTNVRTLTITPRWQGSEDNRTAIALGDVAWAAAVFPSNPPGRRWESANLSLLCGHDSDSPRAAQGTCPFVLAGKRLPEDTRWRP